MGDHQCRWLGSPGVYGPVGGAPHWSAVLTLGDVLDAFVPRSAQEEHDVSRVRSLIQQTSDPWTRAAPLHTTGSAIVLHPPSRRVLLRWHQRQQAWLQVGGHADPGETNPFLVALREGREETGLADLTAWPDAARPLCVQIVIVPVPAGKRDPAHEHADFRYVLATATPDLATPEAANAQLRWLMLDEAIDEITEDNLRTCLLRVLALTPTP